MGFLSRKSGSTGSDRYENVLSNECFEMRLHATRHITALDEQAELHVLREGVLRQVRARDKQPLRVGDGERSQKMQADTGEA